MEKLPFLNMSRSLGDFWSLSPATNTDIISPEPDVVVHELAADEFLIMASDGIWDMMSAVDVAASVLEVEYISFFCYPCLLRGRTARGTTRWASALPS